MSNGPDHSYHLSLAGRLLAKITTRDDLHLAPPTITKAAAKRLRQGLRHLEAYLRRVLIFMALMLEPSLKPNLKEYVKTHTGRPRPKGAKSTLRVLDRLVPPTDFESLRSHPRRQKQDTLTEIPTAPLLEKLARLKALIETPDARARRLAYALNRRRPGLLLAPNLNQNRVPNRLGTEISAIYDGLGHSILTRSRARPPPLPPVPRAGPRIRYI
ncbi:MAG: hypothetical protein AAGK66_03725 [Pseudomonadota bacterium]